MTVIDSASAQQAMGFQANPISTKSVRNYVFRRMPKVRGYLSTVDALAIASILTGQSEALLDGGVAEIGVFFGRSFYLMAMLLRGREKALAIDLFNIGAVPKGDSRQLTHFLETGRRMGLKIERDMALVGDATNLSAEDILKKTGPIRFFSVDGGHWRAYVMHDAYLAANTLADHGVICFDDFCNPEWPDVTLAIYDFLRAREKDFVPFLVTQKKLFVCKRRYSDFYRQLTESAPGLRKVKISEANVLDNATLLVRTSHVEYLRCEAFARAGLGLLNTLAY